MSCVEEVRMGRTWCRSILYDLRMESVQSLVHGIMSCGQKWTLGTSRCQLTLTQEVACLMVGHNARGDVMSWNFL